jgi:phosphotransferase system IIB component
MNQFLLIVSALLGEFEVDPTDGTSPINNAPEGWLDQFMSTAGWVALIFGLVAVIVFIFIAFKYKKTEIKPMSQDAIEYVITSLGGNSNLVSADSDGQRLRFTVKNVSSCDLVAIKDLGASGIFVSGNQVKLMFPFDATQLIISIQQLKKEV